VISLGGIVVGRSIKLAGDDMDQSILHYIRLRHGLLLGEQTAEDIKIKIGSAYEKRSKIKDQRSKLKEKEVKTEEDKEERQEKMIIVRGRDIETGLPRSLRLSESEVREALTPVLTQIVQAVADVLEETPPELLPDILEYGILLTGGGANLEGLDQLIVDKVHMPVMVSSDPMTSVVRGTGKVLEDPQLLNRVKVIGGLK
jgi:rod shape-determining protein MreB